MQVPPLSFKAKNHRYKEGKKNGGKRNQIMKMNQNCAEACQVSNLLQGWHSSIFPVLNQPSPSQDTHTKRERENRQKNCIDRKAMQCKT